MTSNSQSLMERLIKNSSIKLTAPIKDSTVFGKKEWAPTQVPMINVALSGCVDGGLLPGLLTLAGPSKHFKTAFALLMAAAFQKKHKDGIIFFYDSEFGSPESYFANFGVDTERVVHSPLTNIEELKFDIMQQLDIMTKKDKVLILIDSIGNLASKKEVDDAMDGKSVADMTRAKQFKSLFRMVTPHLNLKDIPMVVVNHTYKTMELYSKDVVSGGTGAYYSSDAIWIIGRQQEKDDKVVSGYNFIINIEKSRHVREKSKIPISVTFEGGISKWSGLIDVAVEGGYLLKGKSGHSLGYQRCDPTTGEVFGEKMLKVDAINTGAFWGEMFKETDFADYIKKKFSMGTIPLMDTDEEMDSSNLEE